MNKTKFLGFVTLLACSTFLVGCTDTENVQSSPEPTVGTEISLTEDGVDRTIDLPTLFLGDTVSPSTLNIEVGEFVSIQGSQDESVNQKFSVWEVANPNQQFVLLNKPIVADGTVTQYGSIVGVEHGVADVVFVVDGKEVLVKVTVN